MRQFTNGTLTVEGQDPLLLRWMVRIKGLLGIADSDLGVDERQRRKEEQIRAVEAVHLGTQWIGTDEAGKGDFYGPLVGAAVLVDQRTAALLEDLGAKDSKDLSDRRNVDLAAQIREICGSRAQIGNTCPL